MINSVYYRFFSTLLLLGLMVPYAWAEKKYAPGELVVKYKETTSSAALAFAEGSSFQAPGYAIASLQRRYGLRSNKRLFHELDNPKYRISNRSEFLAFLRHRGQVSGAARFPQKLNSVPNLHNIYVLKLQDTSADMESLAKEVRQDPAVEYAHPNYLLQLAATPNDPSYGTQWAHPKMSSPAGWDLTTGNPSVVLAIVDTGISLAHPDLAPNLWVNTAESGANSINGVDDDSNGFIDDVHGWNFADPAPLGNTTSFVADEYLLARNQPQDTYGHGSLMAGAAAAAGNNAIGIAGTAWNCKIMPLKTALTQSPPEPGWTLLNPVYMLSSWVASGVTYAADNGASVINLSMVDINWPSAIKDAIDAAYAQGVVVVASAGNNMASGLYYPAAYSKVIGVAATDQLDQKAVWGIMLPPLNQNSGTNYGTWVTVAAPGTAVLSTSITGYATASGTSMSTALVSGLAALVRSLHPAFTQEEVKKVIYSTTDPVISDQYIGSGRVNVQRALQMTAVPIAQINTPAAEQTLATGLNVMGSAGGSNFVSYTLDYGQRLYPSSWTTIATSTTPVTGGTLAFWDLTSVTDNMQYTLRLRVTDASGNVSLSETVVFVQKSVQPGWPKTAGDFFSGQSIGDCIATGDLDSDGDQEIAVSVGRLLGGPNQTMDLYVYHHDGSLVLGWPRTTLNRYMSAPTIADLTNSGEKQIIVGGNTWGSPNSTTTLHVFNKNGSYMPGWPKIMVLPEDLLTHTPSVGDLDNDGNLEIVFPTSRGASSTLGPTAVIFVYRYDGTELSGWPKTIDLQFPPATIGNASLSHACLADLNEDGHLDILCGMNFYGGTKVCAWDYQGNTLTGWPVSLSNPYVAKVASGDIDHDTHPEVVASAGNTVYAFKGNGAPLTGWPVSFTNRIGQPIMADLNGDNRLEIVFCSTGHQVFAYADNGTPLTGWPVTVPATFVGSEVPTPIIADLDNDGAPEVIYSAGEDTNVYAWHANGTLVTGWPKTTPQVSSLSPVAQDMNADGNSDLVIGYGHTLNLWGLNTPYNSNTSAWPSLWSNAHHTASYISDNTPPTVSLTAPASGSTLIGNVTCTAVATDNVGVTGVVFKVDGAQSSTVLAAPPYTALWNSFLVPNGTHTLTAMAWDAAGNRATSPAVTVNVNNPVDDTPPTVSMISPASGATVSGALWVSATAQDTGPVVSGMSRVQFVLDGANLGSPDTSSPYLLSWNSSSVADGPHMFSAWAWDAAGNSTLSASVSFTVANGSPVPTATLTPTPGLTPSATPTPTATPTPIPIVGVGEIKVIGSTAGRGVVNPARGESAKIYFRGSSNGVFEIRIFTLAGEQVYFDTISGVNEGYFEWKADSSASGIYIAVVQGPGIKARKKIAVLK